MKSLIVLIAFLGSLTEANACKMSPLAAQKYVSTVIFEELEKNMDLNVDKLEKMQFVVGDDPSVIVTYREKSAIGDKSKTKGALISLNVNPSCEFQIESIIKLRDPALW